MTTPAMEHRTSQTIFRDGLRGLASLLYPPICYLTDRPIESGIFSQEARDRLLVHRNVTTCRRCGNHVGPHLQEGPCDVCRQERWAFDEVVALGKYEDAIRDAVLQIKNLRGRPLTTELADMLVETKAERLAEFRPNVVTCVPLHWRRQWARGYNQAEEIGRRIARRLDIRYDGRLVRKTKTTPPQHLLNPTERRRNLQDAFVARRGRPASGLRVILVDDVMTTGRTCDRVAKVLRQAGAEAILAAVIARAGD